MIRLAFALALALALVLVSGCGHPGGPYGYPTPDGWTWASGDCDGRSNADGATRVVCIQDGTLRHDFIAAHEVAHAWDMWLGTWPLRTDVERERLAWCVAELMTGHRSDEWIGNTYYGVHDTYECPRAGQVWTDAQLLYAIMVS